jgi:hypothetical protein
MEVRRLVYWLIYIYIYVYIYNTGIYWCLNYTRGRARENNNIALYYALS